MARIERPERPLRRGTLPERRPAEVATGLTAVVGAVIAWLIGTDYDPDLVAALTLLLGALPGLITAIVERFGR